MSHFYAGPPAWVGRYRDSMFWYVNNIFKQAGAKRWPGGRARPKVPVSCRSFVMDVGMCPSPEVPGSVEPYILTNSRSVCFGNVKLGDASSAQLSTVWRAFFKQVNIRMYASVSDGRVFGAVSWQTRHRASTSTWAWIPISPRIVVPYSLGLPPLTIVCRSTAFHVRSFPFLMVFQSLSLSPGSLFKRDLAICCRAGSRGTGNVAP